MKDDLLVLLLTCTVPEVDRLEPPPLYVIFKVQGPLRGLTEALSGPRGDYHQLSLQITS